MSIQKISRDLVETFTVATEPSRYFSSASNGQVSGSVYVFARRSDSEKDVVPTRTFFDSHANDVNIDSAIRSIKAHATASGADIRARMDGLLDLVHSQSISARKSKALEIKRYTPGVSYSSNTVKKALIKDNLMPFYRPAYPTAHWAYTNYNCLNFFTASSVPSGSALLYPSPARVTSSAGSTYKGLYSLTGAFSFDFYINPKYTTDQPNLDFKAGTLFHLSSSYAVSLVTGSLKDINGYPVGYRILLQLSQSADMPPSSVPNLLIQSPTEISGVLAWYDASYGFTPSSWADKSGNGHTLTQGTAGLQPALVTSDSDYNNRSVVDFSGDKYMSTGAWPSSVSQPYTWYLVGESGDTTNTRVMMSNTSAGNPYVDALFSSGFVAAYAGVTELQSNKSMSGTKRVIAMVFDGDSSKLYVDSLSASVTGNAGTSGFSGLIVGNYVTLTLPLNGRIAEIVVYAGAHTNSQVYAVNQYLSRKYAAGAPVQPTEMIFRSDDNSLRRNHWHHVIVRWGTNTVNNGTGSFVIDGNVQGSFVIPSSSIAPRRFEHPYGQPEVLVVGNYYEGMNRNTGSGGVDTLSAFFSTNPSTRDGLINLFDDDSDTIETPVSHSFNHPLNAEVHDLCIRNEYMDETTIFSSSGAGPKDLENVLFYVPPFFTRHSPVRRFVGTYGGVLQTPFFEIDSTTDDPFNVALSFGVGAHDINLENFTRDFAQGIYPRLHKLTASAVTNTTDVRPANDFLYDQPFVRKRNLTVIPCDDGNFVPNFELLSTGSLAASSFVDDLSTGDWSLINLSELVSTGSVRRAIHDETGSLMLAMAGATPENPGVDPGEVLTILQRTRDPSSNEVVFFEISNLFYGNSIKPKTFVLNGGGLSGSDGKVKVTLRDDGYGNLYRADCATSQSKWNNVGNIFYNEGLVVVKSPNLPFFGRDQFEISFKGEQNLHVLKVNVHAPANQLNSSSNPSYLPVSASTLACDGDKKFVFLTGVNFTDENYNVVMKTKFAQPVVKRTGDDIVIRARIDF